MADVHDQYIEALIEPNMAGQIKLHSDQLALPSSGACPQNLCQLNLSSLPMQAFWVTHTRSRNVQSACAAVAELGHGD